MKIVLAGPTLTSSLRDTLGLQLLNAPPGTTASPIAPLAAGLRKTGHSLHIVTTDPSIEDPLTLHDAGVSITFCPLRGAPRYKARWRMLDLFEKEIRHLTQAIKSAQPDIVHAHWTYEFAEATVRSRLPHLVTMHDLGWEYLWQFRDPYRLMRLMMKLRTMPRVRHLTVVAPFMQPKARQYGYFRDVTVIPNSIVVPADLPPKQSSSAVILVSVGNAGRINNIQRSIDAFLIIRSRVPGAELHLFGPELDDAFVNGEPGITGHGNVAHQILLDFLANKATILIHPSRLETFGVITAEAKVRGVPVVAGKNAGGVPYVCGTDAGCELVDIESPTEIAAAVLRVLGGDVSTISAAARQDAQQRFDADVVSTLYVQQYQKILDRARAVAAPANQTAWGVPFDRFRRRGDVAAADP